MMNIVEIKVAGILHACNTCVFSKKYIIYSQPQINIHKCVYLLYISEYITTAATGLLGE